MPKTRLQKEASVKSFSDKLSRANSVVFVDYKGITMSQLSQIRQELRVNSAEFAVTKNNLMRIALKNSDLNLTDETVLDGPTATLFSYGDEIVPIKVLTKSLKTGGIGQVKAGLLNGEFIDQYMVNKLASLPSKEELRGQTVAVLVAPLLGIVGVLQANLRNLVYALEQVRLQKGGEQT